MSFLGGHSAFATSILDQIGDKTQSIGALKPKSKCSNIPAHALRGWHSLGDVHIKSTYGFIQEDDEGARSLVLSFFIRNKSDSEVILNEIDTPYGLVRGRDRDSGFDPIIVKGHGIVSFGGGSGAYVIPDIGQKLFAGMTFPVELIFKDIGMISLSVAVLSQEDLAYLRGNEKGQGACLVRESVPQETKAVFND